jgi:S1-C subfamily serine protease
LLASGAVVAIAIATGACGSAAAPPKEHATGPRALSSTEMIERAQHGVVQVHGKTSYGSEVSGTGWVLRAGKDEAIIVTAAHVVARLRTVRINAGGRDTVSAQILASFPCQGDVAVLRVTDVPEGLRALPLGEGTPKAGEPASIIGYPSTAKQSYSQPPSASQGSIANPKVPSVTPGADIVRLRYAVMGSMPGAPGNSGAPLLNRFGQVIGIHLMSNRTGGVQNQTYALPVAEVQKLIPAALKGDSRSWQVDLYPARYLDVRKLVMLSYGRPVWARFMEKWVRASGGLFVMDSKPGGAADKAHLEFGDWITRINGTRVGSVTAACDIMQSQSPGDAVEVQGYHLISGSYWKSGTAFKRRVRVP